MKCSFGFNMLVWHKRAAASEHDSILDIQRTMLTANRVQLPEAAVVAETEIFSHMFEVTRH
jgi:hypothetical protein